MAEVRPAAVAVERVFFQANVRTAMSVGQASGLALAVAARAGVPVCQYTPNEVKQAVAGYGAAGKAQVQAMVARLLRLPEVPEAARRRRRPGPGHLPPLGRPVPGRRPARRRGADAPASAAGARPGPGHRRRPRTKEDR